MYVSYSPEEFDNLLNVTISDIMEIVHPERKKVVNELPSGNNTDTASNSTYTDNNNNTSNKENNNNSEQKVKSDL